MSRGRMGTLGRAWPQPLAPVSAGLARGRPVLSWHGDGHRERGLAAELGKATHTKPMPDPCHPTPDPC